MSLDLHRQAEVLMGRADALAAQGQRRQAADAYARAARLEIDAYRAIPAERVRTRGIVAVSAVSLLRKAGLLADAARNAHRFLADDSLTAGSHDELDVLLDDIRNEQRFNRQGRVLGQDRFEWILRGPSVGHGIATLETVLLKGEQIGHLAVRVYEYLAQLPLRTKGPADPAVREGLDVVVSQPAAGSYRFTVQFSMPSHQMGMFEDQTPIDPGRLGDTFGDILSRASSLRPESLNEVVPDEGYRDAFFKLVRNLVPDGRDLTEIEVVGGPTDRPSKTLLTPPVRGEITKHLESGRTPVQKPNVEIDELRGLNLNEGWILLGRAAHERRCYVEEGVLLEDVIEGFVNRRVKVTGHWRGKRFYIDDLVEDTAD